LGLKGESTFTGNLKLKVKGWTSVGELAFAVTVEVEVSR
jgi:hypothetical protein